MCGKMKALVIVLCAAISAAGCASGVQKYTPAEALQAPVGKDYLLTHKHGHLYGVKNSKPAIWTRVQYRQLQQLWHDCVEDLGPQLDGTGAKTLGKESALYALGDGIGSALGSLSFPGMNFLRSGGYGAGPGAGNGGAYGIDRHDEAVRYASGQCMALQINWAQDDDALYGIGVIPDTDAVDPNGIPMPSGPGAPSDPSGGRNPNPSLSGSSG